MNIGHIAVYTEDIEKSIAFYNLFGGKETNRVVIPEKIGKRTLVHIDIGGVAVELVCPADKSRVKTDEGVVGHFCICTDNIEETSEMLKKSGVDSFIDEKPVEINVMGIYKKQFLKGPSGEIIELIQKKV